MRKNHPVCVEVDVKEEMARKKKKRPSVRRFSFRKGGIAASNRFLHGGEEEGRHWTLSPGKKKTSGIGKRNVGKGYTRVKTRQPLLRREGKERIDDLPLRKRAVDGKKRSRILLPCGKKNGVMLWPRSSKKLEPLTIMPFKGGGEKEARLQKKKGKKGSFCF